MSFFALLVSSEQISYAIRKETGKTLLVKTEGKTFAFVGKSLEHLESREILSVHRPKLLIVLAGLGYKFLSDWIWCCTIT